MSNTRHSVIPSVWMVVFNSDNKLLLLRRYNTGWRDGWYTVPAGHVEEGESPSSCAVRELNEEAGLEISKDDLEIAHISSYVADSKDHERISYFFKIKGRFDTAVNAEPHKADELIWRSIDDLPQNIVPVLRHALSEIKSGNFYSELNYPDSKLTL